MDPALLTALVPLLAAIGGGLAFLINRADKRRIRNEDLLIAHLEQQIKEKDRQLRRKERELRAVKADATSWREQLIEHDITPNPEKWTELPEESDAN